MDAAIHDIDLTLALFGEDVKSKALWATGVISNHHTIGTFGDVDNSIGVVEFWGGKVAYFYHSRTAAHGYDNCTEIVGTKGKISINLVPTRERLQLSSSSGISQKATPGWSDRYCEAFVTELNEFTEAVLEERELPLGLESAYTGLQVALALQESLRMGEKINSTRTGLELMCRISRFRSIQYHVDLDLCDWLTGKVDPSSSCLELLPLLSSPS